MIGDALTVMSAYKLDSFNTMGVKLESADTIVSLRQALARDPTLLVDVRAEPEYLATASAGVNRMLQLVAYAIGSIMALGPWRASATTRTST